MCGVCGEGGRGGGGERDFFLRGKQWKLKSEKGRERV